jgi:Tol biopolymer transport system component
MRVPRIPIAFFAAATVAASACQAAAPASGPPAATSQHSPAANMPGTSTGAASETTGPTDSAPQLGGQILFVDDKAQSAYQQLYIEDADGTNVRQLIKSEFDDQKPALSPDGTKVLFTRYPPDGSRGGGIYVMNLDGSGLTSLDPDGEDVAWSPDGKQIVATHGLFDDRPFPYNVALWVRNADGSDAHQITLEGQVCHDACENGAQDNQAAWSPDGTRIAFVRDTYSKPERFAIFTVAVDGSDLRRVTPDGLDVHDPAWSPDGQWIAFQSPPEPVASGEQNIYKIHPDGTGLTQLTSGLSHWEAGGQATFHPWWSPDGTEIVFSHGPGAMTDRSSLFVMRADGSGLRLVSNNAFNQNSGFWGIAATN